MARLVVLFCVTLALISTTSSLNVERLRQLLGQFKGGGVVEVEPLKFHLSDFEITVAGTGVGDGYIIIRKEHLPGETSDTLPNFPVEPTLVPDATSSTLPNLLQEPVSVADGTSDTLPYLQ
ncbi:uncharacterized protein [Diabrotica undecimpunctata]|uniref:uncharacterized protein n=1 Tax=Diabrotica undecimpunctata TaxID=50387 RepID=UPI003B634351